jgi:hypothetical protein
MTRVSRVIGAAPAAAVDGEVASAVRGPGTRTLIRLAATGRTKGEHRHDDDDDHSEEDGDQRDTHRLMDGRAGLLVAVRSVKARVRRDA